MELQRIGLRIRSLLKLTPPPIEEAIVEEPVVIRRPPILLRLEDCERELETIPQFLGYGWAFGSDHYLTSAIHDSVHRASSNDHPFNVQTARFEIETLSELHDSIDIAVKASQIVSSEHYVFDGPLFAAMFLPSGYTIYGESMVNELVGGPSTVYLRLIQKIAMKLSCRINTIETAKDGATLIIFTPWDTSKTFFDLIEKVDDRRHRRDVDS
ncbi:hypothetical protein D3C85_778990 [compost metagenome]